MRRILAVLLVILAWCSASLADTGDAEALRSFLEQHYDITILMGDEDWELSTERYEVRIIPEGSPPFQDLPDGNDRFANLLRMMDDAFSVYPPGFFSHFQIPGYRSRLRFQLADEILFNGVKIGAFFTQRRGYYDIALARNAAQERSVHHTIWHAMEARIAYEDTHALDGWYHLDPEGFVYTGDYSAVAGESRYTEPEDWFVSEYSKINPREDMATVFDALMTRDEAWWSTRPHLQEKARFILERIAPVFGDLFPGE